MSTETRDPTPVVCFSVWDCTGQVGAERGPREGPPGRRREGAPGKRKEGAPGKGAKEGREGAAEEGPGGGPGR